MRWFIWVRHRSLTELLKRFDFQIEMLRQFTSKHRKSISFVCSLNIYKKNTNAFIPASPLIQFIHTQKHIMTSGFWPRVRARALRAPVFLSSLTHKTGRCAPPRPSQVRCSPQIKNKLFPETKGLPSGPNSGRQGHIFFHWAKLHPTKLRCTLLSYAAPP